MFVCLLSLANLIKLFFGVIYTNIGKFYANIATALVKSVSIYAIISQIIIKKFCENGQGACFCPRKIIATKTVIKTGKQLTYLR
jgi:hypothetical protein